VNISADTKPQASPFDDMFPKDFPFPFQVPTPQEMPKGHALGSGVVISPDGYIVTNNHVVSDVDNITVTMPDKTVFKGAQVKVVGADPLTDIAVLKVQTDKKLASLDWGNSDSVKVGEWAIAVGNPYGLNGTVTVGVISAKGRAGLPLPDNGSTPQIQDFLQTDASINPGNSGGPLVDIHGNIIGINSAIRSPNGGNVGIGFAVPSNMARQVADELRTTGKIAHGYMGIHPQDVTESVKDAMGLASTEGVLVGEVMDNTPAKKAGLQAGDVITSFDGKKITDVEQFRSQVASTPPGKNVAIEYVRDGKKLSTSVELTDFPKSIAAATPAKPETWHGLKVQNLTDQDKEQLGIKGGAVVTSVDPGSAGADAGFQAGDVITRIIVKAKEINDQIGNTDDFNRVTAELDGYKKAIAIHIWRDKGTQIIALTPEQ
jgi:serine protease Do